MYIAKNYVCSKGMVYKMLWDCDYANNPMCFSHMYVHRCLLISAFHLLMTPDCHLYIHIHHIAPHVRPITVCEKNTCNLATECISIFIVTCVGGSKAPPVPLLPILYEACGMANIEWWRHSSACAFCNGKLDSGKVTIKHIMCIWWSIRTWSVVSRPIQHSAAPRAVWVSQPHPSFP